MHTFNSVSLVPKSNSSRDVAQPHLGLGLSFIASFGALMVVVGVADWLLDGFTEVFFLFCL